MPRYADFLTIGDIKDTAINEALGSARSSITALQSLQLIQEIQAIDDRFLMAPLTEGSIGAWSFSETPYEFRTFSGTTTSGSLSAGASSISAADSSGFPSSGKLVIEDGDILDFVDYSANAANVFTVDTTADGVGVSHATGKVIDALYPLPANFGSMKQIFIDGVEYFETQGKERPTGQHYRYIGNYLFFPDDLGISDVQMEYSRAPIYVTNTEGNITTNLATETNIPRKFIRFAVEALKAHIYRVRHKFDEAALCDQIATFELTKAMTLDGRSAVNDGLTAA